MAVTIAQLRDRTANTVQGNATIVESQIVQATTKVSKPEVYSGKPEDTEKFLHQCDLFFTTLNYSDKEKITFALSYMKEGKALSFAQVFHEDWQSQTPPYGGTWTEFKQTSIRNMFGDSDRAATARLHIQDVKMGKGTAEEYIVSFQEHEILSKFGDVALVEAFKRGLNSSLLQRIYALPTMPTTLVEWKEWSRKLDRQYREAQIFQKATRPAPANNSNSSRPAAKAQNVPSSSSSPASATTSRSPVKQEPKTDASLSIKRKGECHICGSPDHWANRCPQRKKKGQNIRVIAQDEAPAATPATQSPGFP